VVSRLGVSVVVAMVVTVVGVPTRAETEPRPRIALFSATHDDPLAGRVAAELELLGLDVTRTMIAPTVAMEEQVRQAFLSGARAAVIADGHRTEFWIAEEGSDRVALRQELEIETSPGLESVLSLRTVEFLRVSLGLVNGPSPLPPPPADGRRRFSITLGPGVLASTGRMGPFITMGGGLRARLVGPVGVELGGYLPLAVDRITDEYGQISSWLALAGGGLLVAGWRESLVSAEAGAGLYAVFVRTSGTAVAPSMGFTDQKVGMAFYGRAAVRFRLATHWSVRLDLTSGSTILARPVIYAGSDAFDVGDRIVTAWGTLFVAGSVGVELRF
jgi:hypothetical protein